MEVLEPVKVNKVPTIHYGSKYAGVYEQASSLNGLALPVQFETAREAQSLCQAVGHQVRRRGLKLRATQRGKTVFLYKPSPIALPIT